MLVSCPKCESRYKLPDDKIRATGTKVRCPRCQHTFHVFPEEVAVRSEEKPVERLPEPAAPPVYDDSSFMESEKTVISPPSKQPRESSSSPFKKQNQTIEPSYPKEPRETSKPKEPSPIKASQISLPLEDESTEFFDRAADPIDSALTGDEEDSTGSNPENPPLRPFGDATFAEIQMSGGRTRPNKKWITVTAFVAVIAATGLFFVKNMSVPENTEVAETRAPVVPAPPSPSTPKKSADWYKDDPAFFQDYLTQMATLPTSEQQRPESRSSLAEALVSNGMMIGADDQVISGMSMASGLLVAYPSDVYGFLGLTALALWKEDVLTLTDLIKRWPTNAKNSLEYKLVQSVIDARNGSPQPTLETMKSILSEYPHYFRAEMWALLVSLEHWKIAEQVFGTQKLQEMIKNFEKRRAQVRSGGSVPTIYLSIEKRLAKRNMTIAETHPKKPPEPIAQVAPKRPVPKEVDTNLLVMPKQTPKAPVKKTLPKADPDLIAVNKQTTKAKQNALKLYQEGNQKQKDNQLDEAITLYQSALREDPDLADVYKQLGIIYMNRQERERALRAFKIYLQLKPESDDRQAVLGWISSMQ